MAPPLSAAGAPSVQTPLGARALTAPLDPGLTGPELFAVRRALVHERNPNHLVGFASSLSPQHPIAASLLYARSALLEMRPRARQEELAADGRAAAERLASLLERASGGAWSGDAAVQWIATPIDAGASLSALCDETGWCDAGAAFAAISPPPVPWPRFERLRAAAEAAQTFAAMRSHGAYDPMLLEACLALTQPLDLATAPLGARAQSPPLGARATPLAATLQSLGFHEAYPLTRGGHVGERAADFLRAAGLAKKTNVPLRVMLLLARRADLEQAAPRLRSSLPALEEEVRRAAGELVVNPGAEVQAAPEVVLLARGLVTEVGPDVRVIDPMGCRVALGSAAPRAPCPDRARWVHVHHREAQVASTSMEP